MADSKISKFFPTGKTVQDDLNSILPTTNGTQEASKIVVPDTNVNIGIVKCTQLHIGTSGSETQVTSTAAELNKLDGYTGSYLDLNKIDITTDGTIEASKAVIVDTNKDAGDFRNLDAVNIDAGASGTAGTIDIFPTTTAKGKLTISATDNTGDTAVTVTNAAHGQATTVTIPDGGLATSYLLQSTAAITANEADVLDGAVAGTVVASKAVVADASKDVGDFRNLDAVNIDAGASGTAGSVDIFPSTTAKGKLTISAADNTGDTAVTITNAEHGQATTVTIPDGGLATSYLLQSTAAITVAEANTLDGAVAGTQASSKVVLPDTNVNIGTTKVTSLYIGTSGSETQITATPADLNETAKLIGNVALVLNTGGSTTQTCTGTLQDTDGSTISEQRKITVIMVTDAEGDTASGTGANTSAAPTTGTALITHTAKLAWEIMTHTDGTFVLTFDNTSGGGAYTDRVAVYLPHSGEAVVSDALNVANA